MATIKDLAQRYGVAKAQDQNENLGRLAEMLGSARDIGNEYKVPSWVPLAGGTGAGDLLMGRTPEEIEAMQQQKQQAAQAQAELAMMQQEQQGGQGAA